MEIEAGVAHSLSARSSTFLSISRRISIQISCSPSASVNGSTLRAEATNATATVSFCPQALTNASSRIARNTVTGVPENVLT